MAGMSSALRSFLRQFTAKKLVFGLLWAGLLFTLGLPVYLDVILMLILGAAIARLQNSDILLSIFSTIFCLIVLEVFFRILAGQGTEYRPHEVLADDDNQRYKINATHEMEMPHGDLFAIDPSLPDEIRSPRTVRFKTDARGYRNTLEIAQAEYVFVGDSFIVSNGVDQQRMLSARILALCGLKAYNIAYHGVPGDYLSRIAKLRDQIGNKKIVLFVFEGNDFHLSDPQTLPPLYERAKMKLLVRVLKLQTARFIYNLTKRLERSVFYDQSEYRVAVFDIGGKKLGFYSGYINAARESNPRINITDSITAGEIAALYRVYLIPAKYRVYYPLITDPKKLSMESENRALASAGKFFEPRGVPVVDLTPALREAAEKKEMVFWPDDTHWNEQGIDIAAKKFCELEK